MDSLTLHVEPCTPEAGAELASGGMIQLQGGPSRAILLAPETIDPDRAYPLITVLHGAGRQDELLVKAYRHEPSLRDVLFLVPRSTWANWDLFVGADRLDLDFLEHTYREIHRRYRVDHSRQWLIGYSDGASYAIAVGLSNPRIFSALVAWAPGFVVMDPRAISPDDPKPRILIEHGTRDTVFPFEDIAVPNREILTRLGYQVDFRIDQAGIHWPRPEFQSDALDWLLG